MGMFGIHAMKKTRWGRHASLAACAALMTLLAFVSLYLARSGFRDMMGYRTRYAFPTAPGAATTPLAERLVLIIVDGLGFSCVDDMPTLKDIAARGAAFSLSVDLPSLSHPAWTTLLSGAPPEVSGVTTNESNGPVAVDTLFDSARRAGMRAVVAGDAGMQGLFGASVSDGAYYDTPTEQACRQADEAVLRRVLDEISRGDSGLVVGHFSSLDFAGHAFGARSAQYRATAAQIDAMVSKIMSAVDLASTALIVTSDHGHTARGGHGGAEKEVALVPFAAAGAGIVAPSEAREEVEWRAGRQVDVAPTCAAILGLSVPAHSQGAVMLDALDIPKHALSERVIRQAQARAAFASRYCALVGARPPDASGLTDAILLHNDGKYDEATRAALELDARVVEAIGRARERMVRVRRLPTALAGGVVVALLLLGAAALAATGAADMRAACAGAAVYLLLFNGLAAVRGISWSLSMFRSEQHAMEFFLWRIFDAVGAGVAAAAFTGFLVGRSGRRERASGAMLAGMTCAYASVVALAILAESFIAAQGVRFEWYLPDMRTGIRYYVSLLEIAVQGLSWPVLSAVSAGALRAFRGSRVPAGARRKGPARASRGARRDGG